MAGAFGKAVIRALQNGRRDPIVPDPTVGASGPAYLFEQVLTVPMVTSPITSYDDDQPAANENLLLRSLWDGIEAYAALLTGMGRARSASVPVP